MEKTNITQAQAIALAYENLNKLNGGDIIWELAHEMLMKEVVAINNNHNVIGEDGTPYTDEDEVAWYDEVHDDYCYALFAKIKEFFAEQEL